MVNPVVTGSDKVADAVRNMKISFKIKTDSEHEFKTRLAYIDRFLHITIIMSKLFLICIKSLTVCRLRT